MRRILALLAAVVLLGALAAPAFAGVSGRWHRLNPGDPSEHEQFHCVVTPNGWSCRYNKLPENKLGFAWDQVRGQFTGELVGFNDPEGCPIYMMDFDGRYLCADGGVTQVVAGTITYKQADRSVYGVDMRLIFTTGEDGWAPLYQYFLVATDDGPFPLACPWYDAFDQALDANPAQAFDCLVPGA